MKRKLLIGFTVAIVALLVFAFTPSVIDNHQDEIIVEAPVQIVWQVVADVGNYYKYATGLSESPVISGKGLGMVRSCSDESGTWQETCTAWDEGESYSFRVDVNSGFPYPFTVFNGTWSVEESGRYGSKIIVSFDYQFPYRWMHWFYNEDTHGFISKGNETLLTNWKAEVIKRSRGLGETTD